MRVREFREWIASDDPPWVLTGFDRSDPAEGWTHRLAFSRAFLAEPVAHRLPTFQEEDVFGRVAFRGADGREPQPFAPPALILFQTSAPAAELADAIARLMTVAFHSHRIDAFLSARPAPGTATSDGLPLGAYGALIDFDALGRRYARKLMKRYLERHDDRRAWLDRRVGATLTVDASGLRDLWEWWTAWRTGDARSTEQGALPEWHPGVVGDADIDLTPPEIELVDAASFFVADVACARDRTLAWELETKRSSPHFHQPVLVGRTGVPFSPRDHIRGIAKGMGHAIDGVGVMRHLMLPDALELVMTWVLRPEPRAPEDGPYELELGDERWNGVSVYPDPDADFDLHAFATLAETILHVTSTAISDETRRLGVTVAGGHDPRIVAREIRRRVRTPGDLPTAEPLGIVMSRITGPGPRPWTLERYGPPEGRWTHIVTFDEDLFTDPHTGEDVDQLDRIAEHLSALPVVNEITREDRHVLLLHSHAEDLALLRNLLPIAVAVIDTEAHG